jgi:pyrimidine deaminase RibD-like protein
VRLATPAAAQVRACAAPDALPADSHVAAAYLNLEPVHGVSAGESASVGALCASGVTRVVVGLLHPLPRLRGQAVAALQAAGIRVDVPEEADAASSPPTADALFASRRVNEALLHRAATGEPFSVWKYAMTLDGKIATRTGHSAWVSGTGVFLRRALARVSQLARRAAVPAQALLHGNECTQSVRARMPSSWAATRFDVTTRT